MDTPSRDDFTSPAEVIVHVAQGQKPDRFNRFRFAAFWLTGQEWVPSGVRGQVFHSDLDRFIADVERRKGSVRVVEPRDAWVGVYVAVDAVYVCALPFVVARWSR